MCVRVCVCVGGSEEHRALHHGRSIHIRALDSQDIQSTQKVGTVLSCGVMWHSIVMCSVVSYRLIWCRRKWCGVVCCGLS